ncbi:9583_t:CDS:1 [Cetraspora pellucida]|uniref:9583_t:CDS:1 n=1 Tax=Cetraspora pellucida TaxID=1433469 RepID=A0A9N9H1W8_9GLOM|nr:9583_t:CDS:1 [Cetraspora pellucida]
MDFLRQQTQPIDLLYAHNVDLLSEHLLQLRRTRGGPLPKMNGKKLFCKVFELRCLQAAIQITPREVGEFIKNERWRSTDPTERYQYNLYAKAANEENERMFMATIDINGPMNVNEEDNSDDNGENNPSRNGGALNDFFNGTNSAIGQ